MREVQAEIVIAATPESTLEAFVSVPAMCQWWGAARGIVEKSPGGVWALVWAVSEAGSRYAMTGMVKAFRPGQLLYLEKVLYFSPERPILGPMEITVRVERGEGGTRLLARQTGYGDGPDWDWYYEAVLEAWPRCSSR